MVRALVGRFEVANSASVSAANANVLRTDNEVRTTSVVRSLRGPIPVLVRIPGAYAAPSVQRLTEGTWVLGASSEADLIVNEPTVSRRHLELEVVAEGVLVRDLGSRNGTFYLGQRIRELVVTPDARLLVGNVEISLELDSETLAESGSGPESYGELVAASASMCHLFALLERLEGSLLNVLIEGESGTGKELIARAIHEHSSVAAGPLVAVNCGAIQRALVQSELFGHKKGAFTGAVEARAGAFEAAHGGTLFLDEIGELPLDLQPVLLRALEERAIVPVGETKPRPVRVRLIAATNRALSERVAAGEFREDLYYRLRVLSLKVPPLRERPEDVALLAEIFAKRAGAGELPPSVVRQICAYSWPGNVRELRHAVESYVAIGALPIGELPSRNKWEHALSSSLDLSRPYQEIKDAFVEAFTRSYVSRLLAHTGGNVSEASRMSGLERSYLNKLAHRFGIRD